MGRSMPMASPIRWWNDHKPFFEWWLSPVYDGIDAFGAKHTAKAIQSVDAAKNPWSMHAQ